MGRRRTWDKRRDQVQGSGWVKAGQGWAGATGQVLVTGDNEELLCEALDKGPGKRATWKAHPRGCAVSARGAA